MDNAVLLRKPDIEQVYVRATLHLDTWAKNDSPEPDYNLVNFHGEIVAFDRNTPEYKEDEAVNVGNIYGELFYYWRSEYNAFDVLDCRSGDCEAFFHAVFDTNNQWQERLCDALEDSPTALFMLQRVELNQAYRGLGIGLEAVKQILKCPLFPNGTFVILKPYDILSDKDENTQKLRKHWKKAGFKSFPFKTEFNQQFLFHYID